MAYIFFQIEILTIICISYYRLKRKSRSENFGLETNYEKTLYFAFITAIVLYLF